MQLLHGTSVGCISCVPFHLFERWNDATMQRCNWNNATRRGISDANSACVPKAKTGLVKASLRTNLSYLTAFPSCFGFSSMFLVSSFVLPSVFSVLSSGPASLPRLRPVLGCCFSCCAGPRPGCLFRCFRGPSFGLGPGVGIRVGSAARPAHVAPRWPRVGMGRPRVRPRVDRGWSGASVLFVLPGLFFGFAAPLPGPPLPAPLSRFNA